MAHTVTELAQEILGLTPGEQRALLRLLLDETAEPADEDVEQAWLNEVERRVAEYRACLAETVPGEFVFERLRQRHHASGPASGATMGGRSDQEGAKHD